MALDLDDWQKVRDMAELLSPVVDGFKVGMRLFYRVGPKVWEFLRGKAEILFADLKLHDIPSTVAGGVRALVAQGVNLLNVHAAGGKAMLQAAVEAAAEEASLQGLPRPWLVAVTVLTSLDDISLREEVGIPEAVSQRVLAWARLARECGLDGVVASPLEVGLLRRELGEDFLLVTPGIRPASYPAGDQKRVATAAEALRAGADLLVVGRPIVASPDPLAAALAIRREMEEGDWFCAPKK
ncbi:orotidine 5'-phosphate decarboxylase [Ammonifex degensii KC4]|uniref:Orotidine 5'-phosphate decarboxylase n=1 Tax=Ammonifex degensii (strain DSM 10501 / KC4) TaxID=429009 RepID=C9RBA3_AMMDK|nr:orotidine-5'-phosphate decarboxylase [Ammonifex degensii]ACX51530.1 orotidine 5'-phosphate decarboxylase [Ammonifex degensii KC4]